MNAGKTLFSQVMEFVPWKSFGRIIDRHRGDAGVRTLGSSDLFRIMAFAQLTWRQSLRDIEACMAANQAKLFHMGLKSPPARSTLADALNRRDWRIYHGLAQRLIARARTLYAQESSLLELDASVYALDSTTIDLCQTRCWLCHLRKTVKWNMGLRWRCLSPGPHSKARNLRMIWSSVTLRIHPFDSATCPRCMLCWQWTAGTL